LSTLVSDVFATGGRDGQIRLWDARTSCFRQQGQVVKKPVNVYKGAHVIKDYRTPPKKKSSAARKSSRFDSAEPPSVTSLVYANEHTLVSGSSHGKSGLRLWDTRKISVKDEGHVLATLEVPTHKDAGITSLCLDRYGSSLFAAVTDSCVYEYGITTSCSKPVRHFTGAAIESFYVQVQSSPTGDYLLCGSKNQQAVIYIVSMDDELFRVWNADNLKPTVAQESGSKSEFISCYELNESEKAVVMMKRVLIKKDRAAHITTSAGTGTPTRKRKEPFTSPLKRLNTPTKSPTLASPVLPLSNITNVDSGVSTPCSVSRRRKRGAFYYRYPTENLPNKVYERFVAKFKAKRLAEKREASGVHVASDPPSTCKKNISDYCTKSVVEQVNSSSKLGRSRLPSINDFGDSVCSKMLSEQDRAVQNSPRKLTVKLTPLKAQPLDRIKEQNCNSQRRSSRNLLDYFSKK
uniref:WD_REPEATS_REGION domain-containing protein n=1 Tax=Nippostrongylus brasiliensis TaxID=27835 RepID=A0A0N4XCM3_NIPBR